MKLKYTEMRQPNFINISGENVTLDLVVSPKASHTKFVGVHDGRLKIAIAAPPTDDQANQALLNFLKKSFKIPSSRIKLESGQRSKRKCVTLLAISSTQVLQILAQHIDILEGHDPKKQIQRSSHNE